MATLARRRFVEISIEKSPEERRIWGSGARHVAVCCLPFESKIQALLEFWQLCLTFGSAGFSWLARSSSLKKPGRPCKDATGSQTGLSNFAGGAGEATTIG